MAPGDASGLSITSHVYQILDDCSRYLIATRVALSENAADAIAVVDQAIATARQPPYLFLSDNGSAFNQTRRGLTSQLVTHLATFGTRCITGRPRHPQTQGKDERIHQTTQRWLRAHPVATLDELAATLADFDEVYNHQHPHQSLNMQTPTQAQSHRPRAIPPLPPDPSDTHPALRPAATARTYRSGDFIRWKDEVMARPSKYPHELRERAVRLVFESKGEYPVEFEAIRSIAGKLGDRLAGDAAQVGASRRDRRRHAGRGRPARRSLRSGS